MYRLSTQPASQAPTTHAQLPASVSAIAQPQRQLRRPQVSVYGMYDSGLVDCIVLVFSGIMTLGWQVKLFLEVL